MKEKEFLQAIAAFEQAGASLEPFAALLASYQNSLCSAGFQRAEALQLVKGMQQVLFTKAFSLGVPSQDEDDES